MTNDTPVRMVFDFTENGQPIRSVTLYEALPNVVVGQRITFDHPSSDMCLYGFVTNINHTLILGDETITYVDVIMDSRVPL